MWRIQLDPNKSHTSAPGIKPVNGVNGAPLTFMPGFDSINSQYNDLGFVNIRLHDLFGVGDIDAFFDPRQPGAFNQMIVNVPVNERERAKKFIADFSNARVIFPNAVAGMVKGDPFLALSQANYAPTDFTIRTIIENMDRAKPEHTGGDLMFRIGRTNVGGYEPPANFDIYAALVADLVNRYAKNVSLSGIGRKITYWEVWNEPDLRFFWNDANPERYYEFYAKVARAIKAVDPSVKVGGAGAAFGLNVGGAFLDGLLKFCRDTGTPLDFLSWHFYPSETSDPQNVIDAADGVSQALNAYGFENTESLCTEWNISPYASANIYSKVQSAQNAAFVASTLICMNQSRVDKAYYYRGDCGPFGIFNDAFNPARPGQKAACSYTAQAFYLYQQMLEVPDVIPTSDAGRTGVSILAGRSHNTIKILVANYRLDKSFPASDTPPRNNIYYGQHYVDSGRRLPEIQDAWSRENWFGGQDPTTLINHNYTPQLRFQNASAVSAPYPERTRDYQQSANGVTLALSNLTGHVASIQAQRIREGGDLSSLAPPDATQQLHIWYDGEDLRIDDRFAQEYTVTLYTVRLRS